MTKEEAILELCDIVGYFICRKCDVASKYHCSNCYYKKRILEVKGVLEGDDE